LHPDSRQRRRFTTASCQARRLRRGLRRFAAAHPGTADPLPSFGQQLLLLCAHYEPTSGRHTQAALTAVRAGALALPLLLAGWLWRRRGGRT